MTAAPQLLFWHPALGAEVLHGQGGGAVGKQERLLDVPSFRECDGKCRIKGIAGSRRVDRFCRESGNKPFLGAV